MRFALLAAAMALTLAACSWFTPSSARSSQNYVGAAMLGGSAVAAAGVNRAATGQCWAQCPPGRTCNHETGTCELLPCSSGCPADLKCERVGGEEVCVTPKQETLVVAADASTD